MDCAHGFYDANMMLTDASVQDWRIAITFLGIDITFLGAVTLKAVNIQDPLDSTDFKSSIRDLWKLPIWTCMSSLVSMEVFSYAAHVDTLKNIIIFSQMYQLGYRN